MKHFFSPNSAEDQKKKEGFHQEWNTFFPRIQVQTCAQMHPRVKLLEGMQVKTILKVLGGYTQNIWGGYIPRPRFSAPLCATWFFSFPPGIRNGTKYFFLSRQKSLCFCGNRKIYPSSKRPVIWLAFCEKILVNFFLC